MAWERERMEDYEHNEDVRYAFWVSIIVKQSDTEGNKVMA